MRINIVQHTPNENAGFIIDWANQNYHEVYVYHPNSFDGNLPTVEESDLLVLLGGPMSPNDSIGWLETERTLIQAMIVKNKPIFGICLGAQQISKAMGGKVLPAPHKEGGFTKVKLESNVIHFLPKDLEVLHWHQDMFTLPENAELLFSIELNKNQGFVLNGNVVGLQFHVEVGPQNIREIVINDSVYAEENNSLMQSSDDILKMNRIDFNQNQQAINGLLNYLMESLNV